MVRKDEEMLRFKKRGLVQSLIRQVSGCKSSGKKDREIEGEKTAESKEKKIQKKKSVPKRHRGNINTGTNVY